MNLENDERPSEKGLSPAVILERMTRFELATLTLAKKGDETGPPRPPAPLSSLLSVSSSAQPAASAPLQEHMFNALNLYRHLGVS